MHLCLSVDDVLVLLVVVFVMAVVALLLLLFPLNTRDSRCGKYPWFLLLVPLCRR